MKNEYPLRTPRHPLLFYLDIIDGHTHEQLGRLGNLSSQGMMIIITDKPISFEMGQVKTIIIQLPDFDEFTKKFLEVQVEIRWMKPDNNPDFYCVGCHFVNINPDDLSLIQQIQDTLGFESILPELVGNY